MKKICYVATIPAVVHAFLRPHIQSALGNYEVTVICNNFDKELIADINIRQFFLKINRKPSFCQDIFVFLQLIFLFRQERFDIVHSIMPKTGVLAMLAAFIAGVPVRIHTFTGQVWVTMTGVRRHIFKWMDCLIVRFSILALVDSHSQLDFLLKQGVLTKEKGLVIGSGSICGVDTLRFTPDSDARLQIRKELCINQMTPLILYVGRLNRDKGMLDLAAAFNIIAQELPDAFLLLVGSEEDVRFSDIQEICCTVKSRLHHVPFTTKPERFMAAADVFCLPSYREGFGMTIIEAAACGVPAVASRIYGVTDAILEGKTGLFFEPGNIDVLSSQLLKLLTDVDLNNSMGFEARCRVIDSFSSEQISKEMLKFYNGLVANG